MKKGNLLLFYLVIFIFFIQLVDINIKILNQKYFEFHHSQSINRFSFIESFVIIETIKKFYDYKMDDFILDTELGQVYIYYFDEIAYIKFDFNSNVFAKLEYDLVYNSCINYELISEALFPVVDKLKS